MQVSEFLNKKHKDLTATHDARFRAKVVQSLDSLADTPVISQADVMAEARALIASKRRG